MSQSKKKRTGRRAAGQTQSPEVQIVYRNQISRRTAFVIVAIVAVLILVIFGIAYYPTYIAPLRQTVITVDDVSIRMDYFLKRIRASGSDAMSMLSNITKEEVLKMAAPQFGIVLTDEAIDQELRRMAGGESGTITESEFKEWYRQRLDETKLSDSEYRGIVATGMIGNIIHQYLAEMMPTVAEQIHVHTMLLETEKEAEQVKARLEAGEDFAAIARELSLDSNSRENGGDLGWVPQGVLTPQIEYNAWDLEPGTISDPIPYYDTSNPETVELIGYYIIWVSEKAEAREVAEEYIPTLQNKLLDEWLAEETQKHEVRYHGFNNGFDSETYAWINWQLSKRQ